MVCVLVTGVQPCALPVSGAIPCSADVARDSGNISPETIAAVLTDRKRAIIPVHLAGWPADMLGIMALAGPRNIKVIEDCAQAHGAAIDSRMVGSLDRKRTRLNSSTNAHLVCRLLHEKKNYNNQPTKP